MSVVMLGFGVILRVFSTRVNHWLRADVSVCVQAAAVKYRKMRVRIRGGNVVDDCAQTGVIGNQNNYY
jgi:hypothetical protein